MNRYAYDGPVMSFDQCINNRWQGETLAPSEAKARSNLTYQCKKEYKRAKSSSIRLPGKIRIIT